VIVQRGGGRARTIVSDTAATFLLKVSLYVVAFGASVLISRGLGVEGRGEYYLPVVTAGTLVTFCKLGLEQANVFLLGTSRLSIDRLSGQNGLVAIAMGGLGVLGLLLVPLVLPALFADTPLVFLLLAGLTIPFALHTQFSAGLLTLQGEVTWQFRAALLAGVMQVALLGGFFFSRWFGVSLVLGVNLVTAVATWGLTVPVLNAGRTAWVRWDAGLLWNTLRQSLMLHLGMVLFFLHLRLDMFMVKGIVGTAALGQYSLSVVLAETVLLMTDSLGIAVLSRQMGNTLEEAALLALRGARANALLGIGLASLWAAGGMMVIRVCFGSEFTPAYLPLLALLPGMVFLGMQRMCGAPALRTGRPEIITAIYAVSLLCNGTLNLWWIPTWGPVGAALASSVSYGLGAVLFLGWIARLAGVSLSEGLLPKRSDLASLWHALGESMQVVQQTYLAKNDRR
jgi:O-antigen/teichoic acid export membrane protein